MVRGDRRKSAGLGVLVLDRHADDEGVPIVVWIDLRGELLAGEFDGAHQFLQLIAEAQELCDVGGYEKFRELFCPQLGKSPAYVRLSIAAGKTTLVEQRSR
jgi:hypothetical protein